MITVILSAQKVTNVTSAALDVASWQGIVFTQERGKINPAPDSEKGGGSILVPPVERKGSGKGLERRSLPNLDGRVWVSIFVCEPFLQPNFLDSRSWLTHDVSSGDLLFFCPGCTHTPQKKGARCRGEKRWPSREEASF